MIIIIKTEPLRKPKISPRILFKTPRPKRPITFDNKNTTIEDIMKVEKKIKIKARIFEI